MLFKYLDRTKTEQYYNLKIVKLEMTIDGVSNQLYSQGIRACQQWDEIIKYFALTKKTQ